MSNRTDLATSERLTQMLAELRTDVDAMKTAPQAFGPDALIVARTGRTSGWDVNVSVSAFALVSYRFTFTPATLQNAYVDFVPLIQLTGTNGFEVVTVNPDTSNSSSSARAWVVTLSNDANTVTLQIAGAFKCTDTGTVAVAAI